MKRYDYEPPSVAPPGKVWRKRRGNWVLFDKAVFLWQNRKKKAAAKSAKTEEKVIPFAKSLFS